MIMAMSHGREVSQPTSISLPPVRLFIMVGSQMEYPAKPVCVKNQMRMSRMTLRVSMALKIGTLRGWSMRLPSSSAAFSRYSRSSAESQRASRG